MSSAGMASDGSVTLTLADTQILDTVSLNLNTQVCVKCSQLINAYNRIDYLMEECNNFVLILCPGTVY